MTSTTAASAASTLCRALVLNAERNHGKNLSSTKIHRWRWASTITTTTTSVKQILPRQQLCERTWRRPSANNWLAKNIRRSSSSSSSSSTTILPPVTQPTQQVLTKENEAILSPTTSSSSSSPSITAATTAAILQEVECFLDVTRHGTGDGIICLNVGGTEFLTLRSTIASNSVLADHVRRAEANLELTREGAIFIDRDPCQFDIILQHLRNKVEGLSYNSSSVAVGIKTKWFQQFGWFNNKKTTNNMIRPKTYVQLPKESEKLRDLYVEATHYRIPELQAALCEQSLWVTFASAFANGGNPFDAASTLLKHVRRGLIATGGIGTLMIGTDIGNVLDFEWMHNLFSKQKDGDGSAGGNEGGEGSSSSSPTPSMA